MHSEESVNREYSIEFIIATLFLVFISVAYLVCAPIGVDMDFHVMRIGELGRELGRIKSVGDFPVYIYRNVYYHYGYPIPIFYCTAFLYPFALLVLLGIQPVLAYKIMVLTLLWATFVICRVCVLYWSKDRQNAMRIAFIYAAQPYFLMDLFVKASIGEAFAFLFVPIIVLGYLLVSRRSDNKGSFKTGIILLAVGVNSVVCSHVISSIMVVFVLVVVFVVDMVRGDNRNKLFVGSVVSALLCLLLSSWYVLPMLEQLFKYRYHVQVGNTLSHAPENVFALLIPMHVSTALSVITGRSVPLSEVGGAPIIVIAMIILLIARGMIRNLTSTEKALLLIYGILVVLMSVGIVWVPFERILGFIQFTWRIYFIAALAGTAFIAKIIWRKNDSGFTKAVFAITIVTSVYILFTCFGYFFARDTMPVIMGRKSSGYEYKVETTDTLYIPQTIEPQSISARKRTVIADGDGLELEYEIDDSNGQVIVDISENPEESYVHIPFIMYEGYSAYNIDSGKYYDVMADDEGYVQITIPEDEVGSVIVRYTGTLFQRISLLISLFALAIVIFLVI